MVKKTVKQVAELRESCATAGGAPGGRIVEGARLQLRPDRDTEALEKEVARAIRTLHPELQVEADQGNALASPECLASAFVAYASERLSEQAQVARNWVDLFREVVSDAGVSLRDGDDDAGGDGDGDALRLLVCELCRRTTLRAPETKLEVGAAVVAVLAEDGEWHEAVVQETRGDTQFMVFFLEYSKPQLTDKKDIRALELVVDDDDADGRSEEGSCEMCKRHRWLTFHHLIPKDVHATYFRKKLPPGIDGEPSRLFLNSYGTMICGQCHSFVHRLAPNVVLAREFNTLDKILDNPSVQRWVQWASQQHHGR